jgi:D-alanine-D-alanine ligase
VTNLRPDGEISDMGPNGVTNLAQYYLQRDADAIIRSFQDVGVTVESFFNEIDFVRRLVRPSPADDLRTTVVYTTAEGGSGPGRRALIPALCNLLGVPVLNSGAHAATMARHKFHAFAVLRRAGVRMPDTWQYFGDHWSGSAVPPLGCKVIVKPTYESMGIGVGDDSVRIVDKDFGDWVAEKSKQFGQPAIVQEFISGDEVGVPVARFESVQALPPIAQRRADGGQYGVAAKTFYDEHVAHDISHAEYVSTNAQLAAIRNAAILAFDSLEMRGVGRIDFRIDTDGRAWVFDTNGEPPPMPRTCWSSAMENLGFSFEDLPAAWLGICLLDCGLISRV